MGWRDIALIGAGIIGSGVAIVHGILVQLLMVGRVDRMMRADERMTGPIRRLVPLLLHFSTFNWFVGGLALIAAAVWLGPEAKLVTGLLVGSAYLFGALGNLRATRGRHFGWMLYAVALGLIAFGLA